MHVVIFQHMHYSLYYLLSLAYMFRPLGSSSGPHKTPGPDDDPRGVETCRPVKVNNKEENSVYAGK